MFIDLPSTFPSGHLIRIMGLLLTRVRFMSALHSPSWEKPLKATIPASLLMDRQEAGKVTGAFTGEWFKFI